MPAAVDVVVPTTGRPSLGLLLRRLAGSQRPPGAQVIVVDDRREAAARPSELAEQAEQAGAVVLRSGGRGPAAARNVGWRASAAEWIAFLDDDVLPGERWWKALLADLAAAGHDVAGSQGRVRVPLPRDRAPTDWERNVAGLERARWATADLAYRRTALASVGGFDERFPRAYREDSDLGLRLTARGWRIEAGSRESFHPVPAASPWVSVAKQAGNADDVLMRALHGRGWRRRCGAPRGRRRRHVATAVWAAAAVAALVGRRRRIAAAAAAAWLAGTAELAWTRIAPGPRTWREVATMVLTSAALPLAATASTLAGAIRLPVALRDRNRAAKPRPAAVFLDRDGTLIADVPYNDDPSRVRPMPGAREAVRRLRREGIPTAVVSNQSGIGRGLIGPADVAAVNRRIDELLGPLGPWLICPHAPGEGCTCRKPAPGLLLAAARALGVDAADCAVIGDIGADVEAAGAVGARAVLVPNERTRDEEVEAAPVTAPTIAEAVAMLVEGRA